MDEDVDEPAAELKAEVKQELKAEPEEPGTPEAQEAPYPYP